MRRDPSDDPNKTWNTNADLFMFGVRAVAIVPEVFLHRGFGRRYLGLQAAAAVLLVPMFSVLMPGHDPNRLLQLTAFYVMMCVVARIGVLWNQMRRRQSHSFYSGRPWATCLLPRMSEANVKKYAEPALIFGIAAATLSVDQLLGAFLLVASFCLFISVNSADAFERVRALDLNDSLIQQRELAHRVRSINGDRL